MKARERVAQLIKLWPKVYPDAHTELDFKKPLELLIATILSAQCTDKRVNMVTPALFKKYRTAKDYASAPAAELEPQSSRPDFFVAKQEASRARHRRLQKNSVARSPARWSTCANYPVSAARPRTWSWEMRLVSMRESLLTHT